VSTNKAQPRLGFYETTALESSHYDTIHPLTTQGMARPQLIFSFQNLVFLEFI
jgi:hypothetical protein